LYTYLTIEEKRHEILTIMISLLSNSEVYEKLNQGYLKVLSHQKRTLGAWLKNTLKKTETYCGLFKHHNDAWGDGKRQQYVQNIIFRFAPSVKGMDRHCLDTRCQLKDWYCNDSKGKIKEVTGVRNGGLCMKACTQNDRCAYWQYKVAEKKCELRSMCGFDRGNQKFRSSYNSGIDRPTKQSGWILGARNCQSVKNTKDDRELNCKNLLIDIRPPNDQRPFAQRNQPTRLAAYTDGQNGNRPGWCPKNNGHTCHAKGVIYSAENSSRYKATGAAYPVRGVSDAVSCQNKCELNPSCNYFCWHTNGACYLLRSLKGSGISAENSGRALAYTSGYKRCAQGEYGATWDFNKFWFPDSNQKPIRSAVQYRGVANTELCQKLCLSRSGGACEAWTFNFQFYNCILFQCKGPGGCIPTRASLIQQRGSINAERSLEDTPIVSGPRIMW